MKQTTTHWLFNKDGYDLDGSPLREPWADFVSRVESEIQKVPPEHRASVEILLDYERGWHDESPSLKFGVFWQEEETDADYKARLDKEAKDHAARVQRDAKAQEARERTMLKTLLKKYGNDA